MNMKPMSLSEGNSHVVSFAMTPIRIVVMGPPGVGKTSIIRSLKSASKRVLSLKGRSRDLGSKTYVPTDYPYYPHRVKIGGHDVEVLDTAGSAQLSQLRNYAIRTGDAFVLVFAVDDMSSFEQMAATRKEIQDIRGDGMPVMVLGNKADVSPGRQVPMELADCLVSIDWEHTYSEVSARDTKAVCRAFKTLAKCNSLQTKLRNMSKRRIHSHAGRKIVFLRQLFRSGSDRRESTSPLMH